jgi:hypothetical protein
MNFIPRKKSVLSSAGIAPVVFAFFLLILTAKVCFAQDDRGAAPPRSCTSVLDALKDTSSCISLDLSKHKLSRFPDSVFLIPHLQSLNLTKNKITFIPAEINRLTELRTLILDGNQIESLPSELFDLSSLNELSLISNRLTSLPDEISRLRSLQKLNLWGNSISSLPESVAGLKYALKELDLRANPVNGAERNRIKAWLPQTLLGFSGCDCNQ